MLFVRKRSAGLRWMGIGGPTFNGHPYSFYSLLDTFSTPKAAGSVNGTLPDVGGARVVTDGNSELSIAGGVANFATGGVGTGDPGLWYATQARVLGKTVIGDLVISAVSAALGWDSGQSGIILDSFRAAPNSTITLSVNGINIVVGNLTGGTVSAAVVMRAVGIYIFAKGAGFTNWSLLWQSALGSAAGFPAIAVVGGTTCVFTADNIRVPATALFIPPCAAYDTFTRANGALGSTELVGPDGASQVTPALAWTGSTYTISTNKAINTPTFGADVIVNGAFAADTDWSKGAGWTIAAGTAVATAASADLTAAVAPLTANTWYQTAFDQGGFAAGTANVKLGTTAFPTHGANGTFTETGLALTTAFAITGIGLTDTIDNVSCKPLTLSELIASVVLATADVMCDLNLTQVSATDGKQTGIITNLDSAANPQNFRLTYYDGKANVIIVDWIAGVATVKQTTAVTYSAGKPLRVITSGTTLTAFYNSLAVGAAQTMAANTNLLCAMFSTSPLVSLDVFQVFARGTSGEYVGLSSL
jgi:hypothetical protein